MSIIALKIGTCFQTFLRSDGQSTLAPEINGELSVSGAWRINRTKHFMGSTPGWLNNLKLRASWGISGNAAISPYETLTSLSGSYRLIIISGKDIGGNIPSNMGNKDLQWETTEAINVGLDFGILNNRISGSVEYYQSETSDLLYYRSAPPSEVYPSVIGNIGSTKGHGIEVSLNTLIAKTKDFSYDVNWSYSNYYDEITGLADGLTQNINGKTGQIENVSVYYDYEADGIWGIAEFADYSADWIARHPGQSLGYISSYGTPGSIKIIDRDDNGKLTTMTRKCTNAHPTTLPLNEQHIYIQKLVSFFLLLYARTGGYISYDMNSQLNYETANWGNLDYWTPSNPNAKFPSPGLWSEK